VSLTSGWLAWLIVVLGLTGVLLLLARRERWWWLFVVPLALLVSAVAAWVIGEPVATNLFTEPLPPLVMAWIGVGIAGMCLALGSLFRIGWVRSAGAVLAGGALVILAGNQINIFYAQYPTLGDVLGVASEQQITGPPVLGSAAPSSPPALAPGPLATVWTPTGTEIPADGKGRISPLDLPGARSGFQGRTGWVYYPPAYFADNPQPLPVLVLMAGQPGDPHDWFLGDRLPSVMNDFAAKHNGIAPVVVVPDVLGSEMANPICADSSLGRVDTYLSQDVPNDIRAKLRVDPNPLHWVIAGYSYGGTCALQMVTNHPTVYRSFVDISGQLEPTLGSRQQTVDQAFGGDGSKFTAINPMDIMATKKFPTIAGWFVVGSEDTAVDTDLQRVRSAAQSAGMNVHYWKSVGSSHDWNTAVAGLAHVMPWMGHRMNMTR